LRVCRYSRGYGLAEKNNNNFMMAVGFERLPMKRLPDAAALLQDCFISTATHC